MEQFVKQLLEELALGRLDICTADVGFRRKGEWMQQEKPPWLAPAVGMLQEASTVGSKDGRKKKIIYIYIKEEKIFTAFLIKKIVIIKGRENKRRREKHQSHRVHKAFFLLPPASLLWL